MFQDIYKEDKMIIVHTIGGIGNQMFQYALFKNLYDKFPEVYYETFFAKTNHNGFELDKVFNITENEIKNQEILSKLEKYGDKWEGFDPEVLSKRNTYLVGNWQNIGYFPDEKILREDLSFKQPLDNINFKRLEEIQNSNSVSIHVRRTDYLNYGGYFFQADWFNYYGLAIEYVKKKTSERPLNFFVFSDDIEWCKRNFLMPVTYIENKKQEAWKDMMLMSNCKHNIIANSTFSWWAAWLNNNPNKIVTTPKKWVNDNRRGFSEISLKQWIKI